MNKEKMFNRLVENGFDFLSQAISELKNKPKYSVIHFYAALELFLKARLMHEHWSLVISKGQDADWDRFINGDFQSVTLEEAANKLKRVVRSGLTKEELDIFKKIGNHRNKVVHFFHKVHAEEENKFRHNIVKEQLQAWYFLHQLLTVKWKNEFLSWGSKIEEINSYLKQYNEFLKVVFDNLNPKIKNMKKQGYGFFVCSSCGFKAKKYIKNQDKDTIYESKCLVCDFKENYLNIECSSCQSTVRLEGNADGVCLSCNEKYNLEKVAEIIQDDNQAYLAIKEGAYDTPIHCGDCGGYETAVITKNNELICVNCFIEHDRYSIISCEYCGENNAGSLTDSYAMGCNACEGLSGRYA